MNTVDLILICIVILSIWSAVMKGFFSSVAVLVSGLGSLLLTFLLYGHIAEFARNTIMDGMWLVPLTFIFTLLVTGSILSAIATKVLTVIPTRAHQHRLNQILGIVPGVLTGILYAAVAAALFLLLPITPSMTSSTRESKVAEKLAHALAHVERPFAESLDPVNRSINKMTINPESSESIALPFAVSTATARPDLESEMLTLLNQEREKENLPALVLDKDLTPVARDHSRDMFARSYFSHHSPEGATPFDRIRQANISFLTAGENLALAQTLTLAHDGLMNSPGHRANILRPTFGRVGIGILDGGIHGLMVTQKFRN